MFNKKTVLFIYYENLNSSCIVAIHFLASLVGKVGTYMELCITFLYPRVRDTSPRPRGCRNYPELPCELTEKLTGTAVRA